MYGKEYHKRLEAARLHMLEYLITEAKQLRTLIGICLEEGVDPNTVPLYGELHGRVAILRSELGL